MHCQHLLFDPSRIPSPCFVLDENRLNANAAILNSVQERTGAKILLALKGYAAWKTFPLLSRFKGHGPLWGACASSVDEARLAREEFGGEVHAFAAGWNRREMAELLTLTDHIVFNSTAQWREFAPAIEMWNKGRCPDRQIQCGLRINPEHSEGAVEIYNPCAPGSRLGIRRKHFDPAAMTGISGLHFHTLCEQGADALERTLAAVEKNFGQWLPQCRWINMGGGHHITRPGYDLDLLCRLLTQWRDRYQAQIYLEPGEAVALDAGWLAVTVLDVIEADMPIAILDIGVPCHMPDVIEMPYRPRVRYEHDGAAVLAGEAGQKSWTCRLAGKSCLAGDVAGEYSFDAPLRPGQRLVFEDMAIYSMVKTTTFNGLRLPSIGICGPDAAGDMDFRMLREFGYADFKNRLS
ncbi:MULTISPECIES: carboxynorspermidine decarboxylase [unclassified Desulfovibrio]|uniref:carboxynorspermidine decarboxylase n=1 Tax=unclassified Desulfovibrio TaxID=2593640 RepID=UPI002FDA65A0